MPVKGSHPTINATTPMYSSAENVMSYQNLDGSDDSAGPAGGAIPSHNPATGTFYV
jgi:hypothetical protein